MRRMALFFFALGVGIAGPAAASRPNILFIISDDHRWDCIGAAGNPKVITPNIDRLAAEGVYFVQAVMHVPQCSPGRAQLLTGLSPHQTGWYSNQFQRPDLRERDGLTRYTLLPRILRSGGYHTTFVGKWHLAADPWNCGFSDVRTWLPGGGGAYRDLDLAQGNSRDIRKRPGFVQEIFANDAIEFLKSSEAKAEPFFLWVAFTAPHAPTRPNPERVEKLYTGKSNEQLFPPGFEAPGPARDWVHYYEAISLLDEQVGRILETLRATRLAENTVVVLLGDNGFMMGSRGWNGKVIPYEESIRVPLIISAPHLSTLRGRTSATATSLDLPPTFLRLAGIDPPKEWSGRNLLPVLQGKKNHGIDHAIVEWADDQSQEFGDQAYRLIRTETRKLILRLRPEKPDELYELDADPHESENRINEPRVQKTRSELQRRLENWMRQTNDPFLQRPKKTS